MNLLPFSFSINDSIEVTVFAMRLNTALMSDPIITMFILKEVENNANQNIVAYYTKTYLQYI